MTHPPLDQHDPAFPIMTMDILNNVLSHADNPGELGQYLTSEIRELTGARCVILLQWLSAQPTGEHRVVSINPSRKTDWANSPAMSDFCSTLQQLPAAHLWRSNDGTDAAAFLRAQGFEICLATPLHVGNVHVGAMLVLDLVDFGHLDAVIRVLDTLATIVALVLRNSFLYEKQEQTIQGRTQELQISNNALQTMNHVVAVCSASSDLQVVLDHLLEEALSITHLEGGTICLVEADNILRLAAQREASETTIADLTQNQIRVGECLCGNCALDRKPLILRDRCAVQAYATREAARQEDIRFHAAFPVMGHTRCIGVLCVFTRTEQKPPERSLSLLEKVTDQISLVVQKVMLLKDLERELAERKRAESAERHARSMAEVASRAKDQFIAVLSHELRTPLTPVLAEVELLQTRNDLPSEVISSLEMIHRNVELESQLIVDLLDITQVVRGELRLERAPTDAHDSIRDALSICQPQIAAKKHHVEMDLGARSHMLYADPVRLRQIFWNLLGNAVKYTPEGGRICLRSRNTPDGRFEVQIIDNGMGIAPEVIPQLFEPFVQGEQTLSRRFGGLGLGLSIAKSLVEAHHGTICVASPGVNQGATFTAEFPVFSGQAPCSTAPPAIQSRSRPVRILLVEDNEDTLHILAKLLRLSRHEVTTATTVNAARELAVREDFDLLLCDIGLPDGTGWDLMRQLASQNRPIKAIALSGFATDDDVLKSKDAGFLDHLAKPIKIDQLRHAIAMAMS